MLFLVFGTIWLSLARHWYMERPFCDKQPLLWPAEGSAMWTRRLIAREMGSRKLMMIFNQGIVS